jgi:hypothetical protein
VIDSPDREFYRVKEAAQALKEGREQPITSGRPSLGGEALMGLRNGRGRGQPFYCLNCHPELGRGLEMLQGMSG